VRRRLAHLAVALYPLGFRRRYGEEMHAVIDDSVPRARSFIDLLRGAAAAHLRPPAAAAGTLDAPEVIRGSASGILACWVLFAFAGFGFYKTTEDSSFSGAQHAHLVLGAAHLTVQAVAVLASLAVVAGALPLILAALWSAREQPGLRRLVLVPFAAVGVFAAVTALLVALAHSRHRGAGALDRAAFTAWALTGALCAATCVIVARRVLFAVSVQRSTLVGSLALGTLTTAGMIAMSIAALAYTVSLPAAAAGLASQPNGPFRLLDVEGSLVVQSVLMCAASSLALITTRRGWSAVRS